MRETLYSTEFFTVDRRVNPTFRDCFGRRACIALCSKNQTIRLSSTTFGFLRLLVPFPKKNRSSLFPYPTGFLFLHISHSDYPTYYKKTSLLVSILASAVFSSPLIQLYNFHRFFNLNYYKKKKKKKIII